MPENDARKYLTPAEVELVLRRAARLGSRRYTLGLSRNGRVTPEMLLKAAGMVGIEEDGVRRALADLRSERAAEPDSLSKKLYGPARIRAARDMDQHPEDVRRRLENRLRLDQGLKLRQRTEASSLYDPGDMLGAVRRALDLSNERALLKARSVELRVEEAQAGRCEANLTADVSGQRGEYLSLGGIIGATLAIPLAIAGVYNPLYFLLVLPALLVPGVIFKLAYNKTCADIRRVMDDLLDDAEQKSASEGPDAGENEFLGEVRYPGNPRSMPDFLRRPGRDQ